MAVGLFIFALREFIYSGNKKEFVQAFIISMALIIVNVLDFVY